MNPANDKGCGSSGGTLRNMTTVGFVGSGQIGSAIARLAIEAGHQVVLSNTGLFSMVSKCSVRTNVSQRGDPRDAVSLGLASVRT